MAKLFREFFGLIFFRASGPPKQNHAQNSRPNLSAFLSNFTSYATTLNPKAGLGLEGNSSEKAPHYRETGPGVQGKSWPKCRYCFSCLKVRGGSRPSNNQRKVEGQQLKGKIVSALFHTFWHFSTLFAFFRAFLQDFLRIKGFYYCLVQRDEKRIKRKKQIILHVSCCTFVLLRHNCTFSNPCFCTPIFSGGIKAPPLPVRNTLANPGFGVCNMLATPAGSGSQEKVR